MNAAQSASLVQLYRNNLQSFPMNTSSDKWTEIKNLCDDLHYVYMYYANITENEHYT